VTFAQYSAWFGQNHRALKIPADVTKQDGPVLRPPLSGFWSLDWHLFFGASNFYAKVTEQYTPSKTGGSQRNYFSYHYGPVPQATNARGLPAYFHTDPVELRICQKQGDAHLHFKGPTPHYGQNDLKGSFVIRDADLFKFLAAVFRHRSSGEALNIILGFTTP
jgi:hypothetical protein